MKLLEHQAKRLFARFGIPVPEGELAATPEEARQVAARLGGKVAVKAQVAAGGRGKAGGIHLADGPDEAAEAAGRILDMTVQGYPVRSVLVERALDIARELYLGLTLGRGERRVVFIGSAGGGVEIETLAQAAPEQIARVPLDPFLGLRPYHVRALAGALSLGAERFPAFSSVAQSLYDCFMVNDCWLAEINPLAVTQDGRLMAVDAKIVLDDNALYRHPDLAALGDVEGAFAGHEARRHGLSYIKLEGEIGCLVNGAGLAMATMDITRLYGSSPANFLDIGGGARADQVAAALRVLLSDPDVRVVLINIFGGITRCDEVAQGIVLALRELEPRVPVVARLAGTREAEGQRILAQAEVITARSLSEAAEKAIAAARGKLS